MMITLVALLGRVRSANTPNTGILASNPIQSMDVCGRSSVLCCPVQAGADPLPREFYQMP
jgi:hypothetical protein